MAGDDEESRDADDFDDELQIKGQQHTTAHHLALNHSVITTISNHFSTLCSYILPKIMWHWPAFLHP